MSVILFILTPPTPTPVMKLNVCMCVYVGGGGLYWNLFLFDSKKLIKMF